MSAAEKIAKLRELITATAERARQWRRVNQWVCEVAYIDVNGERCIKPVARAEPS